MSRGGFCSDYLLQGWKYIHNSSCSNSNVKKGDSGHYSHTDSMTFCEFLYIHYTRVGTLIVATIYLQLIQNRYMFRSFTVLQCSHQHCVQPVASDVEVVGYL